MTPPRLLRVLLIGFMGSGKTTVGRRVAAGLGWPFVDFDQEIQAEAGRSIPEIFAEDGEAHFRALEARVARRLLGRSDVVLASGGGWVAAPGRVSSVPPGTATFWLKVSAGEAMKRTAQEPGSRPLLARADALEEASRLLEARAPFYQAADWAVDTEHSAVEDVSAQILDILARTYTPTPPE